MILNQSSVIQTAHVDTELDSDSDNMNPPGIERTKAETEAFDKGLQVCSIRLLFLFCFWAY